MGSVGRQVAVLVVLSVLAILCAGLFVRSHGPARIEGLVCVGGDDPSLHAFHPLHGIPVTVLRGGSVVARTRSDTGFFSVTVPPGHYVVRATQNGRAVTVMVRVGTGRMVRVKLSL